MVLILALSWGIFYAQKKREKVLSAQNSRVETESKTSENLEKKNDPTSLVDSNTQAEVKSEGPVKVSTTTQAQTSTSTSIRTPISTSTTVSTPKTSTTPTVTPTPTPKPAPTPAPTPTPVPSTPSVYSEAAAEEYIENVIHNLVNAERVRVGKSPLTHIASLRQAAGIRAVEESDLTFTTQDHKRPDGRSFVTVYPEVGYTGYTAWGENILWGYQPIMTFNTVNLDTLANKMFTSWKNSPGHYANMTSSTFNQDGVGVNLVISGGRLYYFGAQNFARR